jgi:hypothetical protein
MDIMLIHKALPGAVAFFTAAARAQDDEAPALPKPEVETAVESKANFLVFFMGFVKESSMSDGLLMPVFAFGTIIFIGAVFFLAGISFSLLLSLHNGFGLSAQSSS